MVRESSKPGVFTLTLLVKTSGLVTSDNSFLYGKWYTVTSTS